MELSPFQTIPLSPSDTTGGQILNSIQKAVIQNKRVEIATQKLTLPFTPNDVLSYTQQEAYLAGQLDILQYLLDASDASEALVVNPID